MKIKILGILMFFTCVLNAQVVTLYDSNTKESVNFEKINVLPVGAVVDNVIYARKDGQFYKRVFTGSVKPEWFGAKGDGVTDDTKAIQKAIDFVQNFGRFYQIKDGIGTLEFESFRGYVITNTVKAEKPLNFLVKSNIFYRGTNDKTAIKLENQIFSELKISVSGVRPADLVNDLFVGVEIVNSRNCKIYLDNISFFTKGARFVATDGLGFAWNTIYGNHIYSCRDFLNIVSLRGGWPNANYMYGGAFDDNSGNVRTLTKDRAFIKFESDGQYFANSWVFDGCSFEGGQFQYQPLKTLVVDANNFHLDGVELRNCRVEAVNADYIIKLGSKSRRVAISGAMYMENKKIVYSDSSAYPYSIDYKNVLVSENSILKQKTDGITYYKGIAFYSLDRGFMKPTNGYEVFKGFVVKTEVGKYLRFSGTGAIKLVLFDADMNQINDVNILNDQIKKIALSDGYRVVTNFDKSFIVSDYLDKIVMDHYIKVADNVGYIMFMVSSDINVVFDIAAEAGSNVIPYQHPLLNICDDCYLTDRSINSPIIPFKKLQKGDKFLNVNNSEIYKVKTVDPLSFETIQN